MNYTSEYCTEEPPVPILSDSSLDDNEQFIQSQYLIPNYHLHVMPDLAVVEPPIDNLYWDTLGMSQYYESQIKYGRLPNPYAKYPTKIAPRQLQLVNKTGRDIYSAINGQRKIEDVYQAVLIKNNEPYGNYKKEVYDFIRKLIGLHHIILSPTPVEKSYTFTGSEDYFVPVHVSLEVTANCNARCKHCYGSFEHIRKDMLQTQTVIELLRRLRRDGVTTLELTGGECSTHPDFPLILEESLQLFDFVAVLTNGIAIPERVFELAEQYAHKLLVQICINGRKPFHDDFVGVSGSFERSSHNITRFAELGVFTRSAMNLTFENGGDIEYVLQHVRKCGASTFTAAQVVITQGRAESLPVISNQLPCIYLHNQNEHLHKLEKAFPGFVRCFLSENSQTMVTYNKSCGVGRRTIYITSNGFFHLCPMAIGTNVPGYMTIDEYFSSETPWDTPFVRKIYNLPAPSIEQCDKECKHIGSCMGCITRGLQNYLKIPNTCVWGKKNHVTEMLVHSCKQK